MSFSIYPRSPESECSVSFRDCNYPFPDDRLLDESRTSATGRIWSVRKDSGYSGLWALSNADGFGAKTHFWIETPCDVAGNFPERYLGTPEGRFWLYSPTLERSYPVFVKIHKEQLCLLEVIPEQPLRPATRYILVIRGLSSKLDHKPLVLSRAFSLKSNAMKDRLNLLPPGVNRTGVQSIIVVTVRSYENLLGSFLHLRNTLLVETNPDQVPIKIESISTERDRIIAKGSIGLPRICSADLLGACSIHVDANSKVKISNSTVSRQFIASMHPNARSTIFIPGLTYQDFEKLLGLEGMKQCLQGADASAFGFSDNKQFMAENREPILGLPSPIPGFDLPPGHHNRLTSMPDREAVRVLHGILLSRLMQQRIPEMLSAMSKARLLNPVLYGLGLEQERDAFALSVNPFIKRSAVLLSEEVKQFGTPFGPTESFPEKEYVKLFWDGLNYETYMPMLKTRKSMPDTPSQRTFQGGSLLLEDGKKQLIRFYSEP